MDAVGATVKWCVWTGVKSRRIVIPTGERFHKYVTKHLQEIKSLYVSKDIVEGNMRLLNTRCKDVHAISCITDISPLLMLQRNRFACVRPLNQT